MKDKKNFRVGDDVSLIVYGKIKGIACGGSVTVDSKNGLMICDNECVFHGHIDGKKHEIKPVRKIKRWVNLYRMDNLSIKAGFKYIEKHACVVDAKTKLKGATLIATAVEIELEE